MAGESKTTTDHGVIRKWAEARGGQPAVVKGTQGADGSGLLRIDFPGYGGKESLEPISWNQFFDIFDKKDLTFLYQDRTKEGRESRFFKLVDQES